MYVTANDATSGNKGIKGQGGGAPISIASGTSALLFEVDTAVPTPTIGLADPNDPTGFVVLDFQAEGTEYVSTGAGAADFDSHDTVTIVAATLDAVDIKATLTTSDNVIFRHSPSNLTTRNHPVVVTAVDVAGNQTQFADSFTVTNLTPVVEAGPDKAVPEGSTLNLDQTTFTDLNVLDTHTAVVDWGDGATSTGAVSESGGSGTVAASHIYPDDDNGPFTVAVTVTDNVNVSHSDTLQANVTNVNPTLEAGADQSVATGTVMNLAPATLGDLGVLDTHSAVIVWGDGSHDVGTVDQNADTISQSHLYAANGTYSVTIIAIDDDGGFAVDSFKATVGSGGAPPPVPVGAVPALIVLALAFAALLVWRLRRRAVLA